MRLIDVENMKLYYGGLINISPTDFRGIAKYFFDQIKRQPTIDAEPVRHGRWIKSGIITGKCSECGEISADRGKYCSDCGAKMDGESDGGE